MIDIRIEIKIADHFSSALKQMNYAVERNRRQVFRIEQKFKNNMTPIEAAVIPFVIIKISIIILTLL